MACPKGGPHKWRTERVWSDGKSLMQCRKCSQFKETNTVGKLIVVAILVVAAALALIYYLQQ